MIQPLWRTVWRFLTKLKTELPYDPAIPFLGIYPEENNRMGKTQDLVKKIRDTRGTFHVKMGTIKDRNFMDLIEAEYIKKRWQEDTELYRNISMTQITMMVR